MNQKINYRPELDGLRTIAVMAVLFYHAKISLMGKELLPGGFLGVDIFFVLSGFLISSIIIKSSNSGGFSYVDFYIKRSKRIFPALLAVLIATSFVAYRMLLPDSFVAFSKSLAAATFFVSNIFFYGEDSYVSEASDMKPLLHTWSLSVEWQFYLLFPVIMLMILRFAKSKSIYAVSILWVASFVLSVYQAKFSENAAFYLLPSRVWELLSGCLVALIGKKNNRVAAWIGGAMVVFSLLFMNDKMQHPSFPALLPVLGACLIMLYSCSTIGIGRILSIKPMVFIGSISYSVYLWHQPIFVFYRIGYGGIDNLVGIALIVASIAMAAVSYYVIEKPFRTQRYNSFKRLGFAGSFLFLLPFSYYVNATNGDVSRLSPQAQDIYKNYAEPEFRRLTGQPGANLRSGAISSSCYLRDPYQACASGDVSWVTIGDSYAGTLDYYLSEKLNENGHGLLSLTYEQCPFVNDIWFGNVPECVEVNKRRWEIIKHFKTKKTIVLAANYFFFVSGKQATKDPLGDGRKNVTYGEKVKEELVWQSFAYNVKHLLELGHHVIVVYPIPSVSEDVKTEYFSLITNPNSKFDGVIYEKSKTGKMVADVFSEKLDSLLPKSESLTIIKPTDKICDEKGCQIINKMGGLYHGGNHLSNAGVKLIFNETEF